MNTNYKKGFTLIELLVVIAIIGLLTSVVLASLNSARERAANASIQSNLSTIRAQSGIYFDSIGGSYAGLFDSGTVARSAFDSAVVSSGETGEYGTGHYAANTDNWTALVKLRGVSAFWCVDSTGFAGNVPYPESDPGAFVVAIEDFGADSSTPCAVLEAM